MTWSDHSSIMNHCHLLLTLSAIYDPTFYYTSEELHGKNVQELVQKPYIYIMAKWRDTIEDQLLYSENRLEDLNELKTQLLSSQKVSTKDICRFFHGAGSSFARGGKWRADWWWLWVPWMHWSISQLYWPCDVVHWGHHTLPSNKEEERYWKVQLEKKEEIVERILSKTWAKKSW